MSKLSIGKHGIQIETHEKSNVMSPFNTMAFIVIPASIILMLISSENWIKILGAFIFIIIILVWIVIYSIHSAKKPELLQSETYRLEIQKIEAGMIDTKNNNNENLQELPITNISVIPQNNKGDIDG